ncbi:PREDICTED: sorting nexin-14-like isoform X2 [Nicrophorus vespilloides]|uniref:Sorting nexin-14-like isoform X2 n=1 Tax=Nicrophorus vespilloides TaxID=110193 RepID=A0ABM1MHQ1_NICVS|nr:PREDICTED: sorting nexin-14-like isoform X2 [Nicrophorus vespilloides]
MLRKEAKDIINLVRNDKITRSIAIFVFLLTILIAISFSLISGLLILSSYIFGFILCASLLKYQKSASICLQRFVSIYRGHFSPYKKTKDKICSICTENGCSRHLHNSNSPWKQLIINKRLNDAVEHFFNRILDQFVLSWYTIYTNDLTFVSEIKYSIKYASASIVTKFLELDIGKIITNKLIPCAIKHVDDHLCMVQIGELKNVEMNKIAVEYLGKRLHFAASNRNNELTYLRHLSMALIERILPSDNLKSKNYSILLREIISGWVFLPMMDVLADPNIINSLVILITTYKSKPGDASIGTVEDVEFLENFSKMQLSNSSLGTDLKTILKNPTQLYAFMQFLKKEGSVNILNFCMDVEAFNGKLLMPDLSKKQLQDLHAEALKIYNVYMDHKSIDFIGCDNGICSSLNKLLEDGVYNVAKLQTSEPLFQAYDFAFNLLETEWMPQFYHSNEFYNIICGSKATSGYSKSSIKSPFIIHGSPVKIRNKKYYDSNNQGAVSKISSSFGKIKGALQAKQPVEGAVYPHESRILESDHTYIEESEMYTPNRDLTAWRISIPNIETHQYGTKPMAMFAIHVQRIDAISDHEIRHWIVHRKDQDFYTLKSKLIEFHGETEICNSPLPSRRNILPMEIRKRTYEDFLKKLLEKPLLKGSDLLHTFLTAKTDFSVSISASMPVVDLENIYQSVAYKLRKEKGQHLDPFMVTFLNSTGRQKNNKIEWAEVGDEVDPLSGKDSNPYPKTMVNKIFGDNFGVEYKRETESSSSSINPNGITESLFYLLKHIFKVHTAILKLYVAVCSVGQQAIESMSRIFIDRKIKSALPQSTLAFLIKELEDVIFAKHIPSTAEQLLERKKRAFTELDQAVPGLLGKDFRKGVLLLLEILQNPSYNKQLVYNLIDIVVAEMYPELDCSDDF